jgi:hypothetical protein
METLYKLTTEGDMYPPVRVITRGYWAGSTPLERGAEAYVRPATEEEVRAWFEVLIKVEFDRTIDPSQFIAQQEDKWLLVLVSDSVARDHWDSETKAWKMSFGDDLWVAAEQEAPRAITLRKAPRAYKTAEGIFYELTPRDFHTSDLEDEIRWRKSIG